MGKEDIRKGPWSEDEDVKLAMYVKLFGDRRWDFIAKVSGLKLPASDRALLNEVQNLGLKRNGKSCRLRWMNYLHPGLKGGKMTPQEQRLVLQLHSKWGNRWSRIASNLPGRTDNEIKNYWRTHMRRKKEQERKHAHYNNLSPNSSQTSSSTERISRSIHVVPPTPEEGQGIQTETGDSMGSSMTMVAMGSPSIWDSLWNMDWEEINKAFTPHVMIKPSTDNYLCRL